MVKSFQYVVNGSFFMMSNKFTVVKPLQIVTFVELWGIFSSLRWNQVRLKERRVYELLTHSYYIVDTILDQLRMYVDRSRNVVTFFYFFHHHSRNQEVDLKTVFLKISNQGWSHNVILVLQLWSNVSAFQEVNGVGRQFRFNVRNLLISNGIGWKL